MERSEGPGVRLEPVEELIGYEFSDSDLGRIALSTWRQGFSRLEFLGDSMLGLAVFATAEIHQLHRDIALTRVSNRHLNKVFNEDFAKHTDSRSGDVIEAIIGAVHLEAGFEEAARVAVTLCLPEYEVFLPSSDTKAPSSPRGFAFVGAAALSAAVADELTNNEPTKPHRWFNDERSRALSRTHLAQMSMELGLVPAGDIANVKFRAKASDLLEAEVGRQFFEEGWHVARASALQWSNFDER